MQYKLANVTVYKTSQQKNFRDTDKGRVAENILDGVSSAGFKTSIWGSGTNPVPMLQENLGCRALKSTE